MKGVEEPKEIPNRIDGTKGKDVLTGTAGQDRIYGGYGNDKLTGGAGADVFVFNSKLGTSKTDRKVNFDTITDFSAKDDTICLDNRYFTKLGKGTESVPGSLNKKFFYMGSEANAKSHYVLYNKKTGILSYDQDGSGAKAAVEIAKMGKNLKLAISDFLVT
jgi:Ca2+-binding RTX toxin-like protein